MVNHHLLLILKKAFEKLSKAPKLDRFFFSYKQLKVKKKKKSQKNKISVEIFI